MTKLEIYSERHGLHRNTDKYMNTPIFFSLERLPGALGIQQSLPSREYDASNVMEAPESLLGVHAPVDGGLEVPKAGLGITLGDAAGLLEDLADGILGGNMTSLGRLGVPLQRFLVALLDAASQLAAEGVFGHPLGMPALGGLEEVLGGRLDVNIDVVVAILIDGSELVGGIEVRACRVGHLEPLNATVVVLCDAIAVQVAGGKLASGGSEAHGIAGDLCVAIAVAAVEAKSNAGELNEILNGKTGVGLQTMRPVQEAAGEGPLGIVAAVFGGVAKDGGEGSLEAGHLGQVAPVGVRGEAVLQRLGGQIIERIAMGGRGRILFVTTAE